jgi:hypothetical protein
MKMRFKKADLTVETIIKIAIAVLILFVILYLVLKNSGAMDVIWERITGFF